MGPAMAFKALSGAAVAAVALGSLCSVASADDTGLAGIHDFKREKGKVCFSDHFHYGNSAGLATKKAAEVEAIKSWSSFTDLEYGSDWAKYSKAASKSMKCSQSSGGWGCELEARPCK